MFFFLSEYQQRGKRTYLWCRTDPVCLQLSYLLELHIANNVILLATKERSVGNDVKIFVVQNVLKTRHVPNSNMTALFRCPAE